MRIAIYDATEKAPVGLSWSAGAWLMKTGGYVQHIIPGLSWSQALEDARAITKRHWIREIQFWGHGAPGGVFINNIPLDVDDANRRALVNLAFDMAENGLIWFRTCASFAGPRGHRFATNLMKTTQMRVAGSTFNIGFPWHSGQRSLRPGATPQWSLTEGLGVDGRPMWSSAKAPNTLMFATMSLPSAW